MAVANEQNAWNALRDERDNARAEARRESKRVDVLVSAAREFMNAVLDYFDATNANNVNGEVWRAVQDLKEVCNAARPPRTG